jgi:hypothetical protein
VPQQAYPARDDDNGPGCVTCAVFVVGLLVIGALIAFLLLKAYAYT